jgi:hypothetical protein
MMPLTFAAEQKSTCRTRVDVPGTKGQSVKGNGFEGIDLHIEFREEF